MKKTIVLLLVLSSLFIVMSSCGKYEEGPAFSLTTKKNRLKGNWELKDISNYNPLVDPMVEYKTLNFEENGKGKVSRESIFSEIQNIGVDWEFSHNKEKISIVYFYGETIKDEDSVEISIDYIVTEVFDIVKLAKTELWLKNDLGVIYKYKK